MTNSKGFNLLHINKEMILLTTLAFLIIGCGTVQPSTQHSSYTYGPSILKSYSTCPKEFYTVVFDAGSTGSRVFVFQFRFGKKGSVLKLIKESFLSTEPGISSFANNISGVSSSLKYLLHYAMQKVPRIYYNATLLTFKATAGLRLLSEEVGDKIIDEVRFLLKKSPFYIPDINRIEIMGGGEEGLFGWVTANFLIGTLWKDKIEDTAIAIDLGGGSVQITYALPPNKDIKSICSKGIGQVYKMLLMKSSFNVFTHSALGNGLKSAYLHIMGGQEDIEKDDEDSEKQETKQLHLFSPCFVPKFNSTWIHGRYTYNVVGKEPTVSRFKDCQRHVFEFVKSSELSQIAQPNHQDIYLFSYFFDVAQWSGIIPLDKNSMMITLSDYYTAAEYHCQDDKFSEDKPFLCMSLVYVHSLLAAGFGISHKTSLYVGNEINGKQLSWALGIGLATSHEQLSYTTLCDSS